jgi:hypothetical protein
LEWVVAIAGERVPVIHSVRILKVHYEKTTAIVTKRWEADCVRVGQTGENSLCRYARRRPEHSHHIACRHLRCRSIQRKRNEFSIRVTKPESLIWQRRSRL